MRGAVYWNRFREEFLDPLTGEVRRRQGRLRIGAYRSVAQAAAALDRYLALQGAEALSPGLQVSFEAYVARYDRLRIGLMRAQSRRSYRSVLRTHLVPALGRLELRAIDASVAQELVAVLHARGLSPSTVGTVVKRLRQILRHASCAGFSAHAIPAAAVKLPSASRVRSGTLRRWLTAATLLARQ